MVEQPDSTAEQYGAEVDLQFIEQSAFDELLDGIRAARDPAILVAAAALACSMALSMPSVTNVKVVPPCLTQGSLS